MIRSISIDLDGILLPRLSRVLWASLKTLDAGSANKAMEQVFPLIPRWKSGALGEEEFWTAAARLAECRPERLKEAFLDGVSIDREISAFLRSLPPKYSIVIRADVPPRLQERIVPSLRSLCPPPIEIKTEEDEPTKRPIKDDTLYLIADSALSYNLAEAHAHVVLFTNLFRSKRELALRRLI